MDSTICVIPARGGSQRIPLKNIRLFSGKPIIAWSIEAALSSGCFDRIFVSTDDERIADVSLAWGAEVPFLRPSYLSDNFTGTTPVVTHLVNWLLSQSVEVTSVCCLYATAPFVRSTDIVHGFNLLQANKFKPFVLTVTSYPAPIQRSLQLDASSGHLNMLYPQYFNRRSQDLVSAFHDAAQFYWASSQSWLSSQNLFEKSVPIILPRWRVQDIDNEEDWIRAELMYQALSSKGHYD